MQTGQMLSGPRVLRYSSSFLSTPLAAPCRDIFRSPVVRPIFRSAPFISNFPISAPRMRQLGSKDEANSNLGRSCFPGHGRFRVVVDQVVESLRVHRPGGGLGSSSALICRLRPRLLPLKSLQRSPSPSTHAPIHHHHPPLPPPALLDLAHTITSFTRHFHCAIDSRAVCSTFSLGSRFLVVASADGSLRTRSSHGTGSHGLDPQRRPHEAGTAASCLLPVA